MATDPRESSRSLLGFSAAVAGVILSMAVVMLLIAVMFWIGRDARPDPSVKFQEAKSKMLELKAADEARLSSYGWVNKQTKTVHIPIERAMQIVVKEPKRLPLPDKADAKR